MNEERRQHPRVARPFEGTWTSRSGATRCRIADISIGGCFVQTLALPVAGETTVLTVAIGESHAITFTGKVVYVDPGMGFAVQFTPLEAEHADELRRLLAALMSDRASA
ncbi:MAG TPA: PilZ domain-containing protein [Vicinamibacterales bacterium]|nr:PilZ domain-containing protein [Vicinamibacterales bacterium]